MVQGSNPNDDQAYNMAASLKKDEFTTIDLMPLQPLGKAPLGGGIPTYILGPLDKIEGFMNLHPAFRPMSEKCNIGYKASRPITDS